MKAAVFAAVLRPSKGVAFGATAFKWAKVSLTKCCAIIAERDSAFLGDEQRDHIKDQRRTSLKLCICCDDNYDV